MSKHPDYPRVSSKIDRHGVTRWRFMDGARPMLPGEPHTPAFDAAYQAIIEGRDIAKPLTNTPSAQVINLHNRTLDAAYSLLRKENEWLRLGLNTQTMYSKTIERMLNLRVNGHRYGDGPVADFERRHVKAMLKEFAETPWLEVIVLVLLRKLMLVAIDQEPQWIKVDPTFGISRNPQTDGHLTWKAEHVEQFEAFYAPGTMQRTAYALALWLGNRASDVARLDWKHLTVKRVMHEGDWREIEGFEFRQFKGRKNKGADIFLPMTPMLERELQGQTRTGPVLKNTWGKAFKDRSLSHQFSKWAGKAGLPEGYTMHGLRKALGVMLAHADATSRQIMFMLGHKDLSYVELYTREAEQVRMAMASTDKLTRFDEQARKQPPKLAIVR
jgi:integrase